MLEPTFSPADAPTTALGSRRLGGGAGPLVRTEAGFPWSPLSGFVYLESPTLQFSSVEHRDSFCNCRRVPELYEGEPPRSSGLTIDRQEDLCDLAGTREQCFEICL